MSTQDSYLRTSPPAYDLFGPRFKAAAYTVYARMRRESPVYRRENAGGSGATCFITTYEDAAAVLRDHRRFVKDVRNTMTAAERSALPEQPPLLRLLSHHMLNSDAPDHTRLRALVNKAFTSRIVDQLQGRIERVAHELLDRIQPQGQADLIDSYALPLPIIVIADLLGIPTRDRNRFRTWSNALVVPSADEARNAKKLAKSRQLMQDFITYLRDVFAARRKQPRTWTIWPAR